MNPVFLDTVGLIAVWDKSDQWHDDAEPVFLKLVTSGRTVLTTTLVLYECGNAAARRPYRTAVDDLRSIRKARRFYQRARPISGSPFWTRRRRVRLELCETPWILQETPSLRHFQFLSQFSLELLP